MNVSPSKPPSAQWLSNEIALLARLFDLFENFTPSRSPTLAAVTKTCKTNPKVSIIGKCLRLTSFWPARSLIDSPRCTLDALTVDDRFRWARCRSCSIRVHSQTIVNFQPHPAFAPVAEICVHWVCQGGKSPGNAAIELLLPEWRSRWERPHIDSMRTNFNGFSCGIKRYPEIHIGRGVRLLGMLLSCCPSLGATFIYSVYRESFTTCPTFQTPSKHLQIYLSDLRNCLYMPHKDRHLLEYYLKQFAICEWESTQLRSCTDSATFNFSLFLNRSFNPKY